MSGGQICRCPESKKPLLLRRWRVTQHRCNHSAFNGGHYTSTIIVAVIAVVLFLIGGSKAEKLREGPPHD